MQQDDAWSILFSKQAVLYHNARQPDNTRAWESRGKGVVTVRHPKEGPKKNTYFICVNSEGVSQRRWGCVWYDRQYSPVLHCAARADLCSSNT